MITANIKAVVPGSVRRVWDTVTAVERYSWRSDLSRTGRLSESWFIEYTRSGYAPAFNVTAAEPGARWELELENDAIKGRWTGIFTDRGGETEIDFTEQITAKRFCPGFLLRLYLKRQQARFVSDLKRALAP